MSRTNYKLEDNPLLTEGQLEALHGVKSHAYRTVHIKRYLAAIWNQETKPVKEGKIEDLLDSVGITAAHRPRNVADINQLFEKYTYFINDVDSRVTWDDYIEHGFAVAYKLFARPEKWVEDGKFLEPLRTKEEIESATKMEKTSGAPFFCKKGEVFDIVYDDLVNNILPNNLSLPPATAYCRTAEENKTRLVFAQALATIILEAQFARPLIQYFLDNRNPMAIGMWNKNLGDILSSKMNKRYVYTFDYSKFDMTICRKFIIRAFKILGTWFRPEDREALHWDKMVNHFIYEGLILPDGKVYYGKTHGVCSGSYFTQMIDSIVNVAILMAISKKFGLHLNAENVFVLGDDSIFCSYTWLEPEVISRWVEKQYGILIHPTKSEVVDTEVCRVFHFLGKYWYLGVPHRPEDELYSRMISPERQKRLSFKDEENSRKSFQQLDVVVKSYCADCDEGMKLAGLLNINVFRKLSRNILINNLGALPGYTQFKLESTPHHQQDNGVFSLGLVGMYAK